MALLILGLGMSSCQQSTEDYVKEVKNFVEGVVEDVDELSEEDWEGLDKKFEKLIKKADKFEEFTTEQSMELVKLQGQYAGVKVKSGAKSMMKGLKKGQKAMEGLFEGMEDKK